MKRLFLTPEEKAELEIRHQACENKKEGDRIKAILLRSEGWTVPQISQVRIPLDRERRFQGNVNNDSK